MKSFLRGMLIHPALGTFAGKEPSVFQWNITMHYTTAKFNGRRFTPEELMWPAFYPPISRVRITILNQFVDIGARHGHSPVDDFGFTYISVKDVLLWTQSWLRVSVHFPWWDRAPNQLKELAVKAYAQRTGDRIKIRDEERDIARQLARADPSLPFPQDIISSPINNHPDTRKGCRACVQCAKEIRTRVLNKMFDKFIKHDRPCGSRTKLIYADVIPVGRWFKGLANIGPYSYYLETMAQCP